jgi:hypothetical protein
MPIFLLDPKTKRIWIKQINYSNLFLLILHNAFHVITAVAATSLPTLIIQLFANFNRRTPAVGTDTHNRVN